MEVDEALDLGREAFLLAFTIAAPILVIGLMVGLTIALVQAVTQLHEQTLTFVPKILAMAGAAAFFILHSPFSILHFFPSCLGAFVARNPG